MGLRPLRIVATSAVFVAVLSSACAPSRPSTQAPAAPKEASTTASATAGGLTLAVTIRGAGLTRGTNHEAFLTETNRSDATLTVSSPAWWRIVDSSGNLVSKYPPQASRTMFAPALPPGKARADMLSFPVPAPGSYTLEVTVVPARSNARGDLIATQTVTASIAFKSVSR